MSLIKDIYTQKFLAQPPVVKRYIYGAAGLVVLIFGLNLFYLRILGDDVETWRPNNSGNRGMRNGRPGYFYHK